MHINIGGLDKFQESIIKEAQNKLLPLVEKHRDDLAEVMKNDLFDLDGPKYFDRKPSDKELYFGKIFRGFNEVSASLQTLEDIAFYISRFPYKNTKITRERYLQFYVEAYYSEIYILRERLNTYFKLHERQHKNDSRLPKLKVNCEVLSNLLTKSLEKSILVRGRHVHEARFRDDGINKLTTLAMLSNTKDQEFSELISGFYIEKYHEVRQRWKKSIKDNNKKVRTLIDFIFDSLYPLIFDAESNSFIYPTRFKD